MRNFVWIGVLLAGVFCLLPILTEPSFAAAPAGDLDFPPSFESYGDAELESIGAILANRIAMAPFNLIATLIFFAAIIHTFLAGKFLDLAHARAHAHQERIKRGEARETSSDILAGVFHFLGEIEVVFGLWTVPLLIAIVSFYDWSTAVSYIDQGVNLTEAAFVIVIMVLASTRPILKLAESLMLAVSRFLGGTLGAFWVTAMTIGPLLGSVITEPAAMTITAVLLAQKFYDLEPSAAFKYATLGLLFVNVSIGGTLTHFAAPPILMVAGPWGWDFNFMITTFGWKAIIGIVLSNAAYFLLFRQELTALQDKFALQALKDDISRRFVPRDLMEQEYRTAADEVDAVQNTGAALEAKIRAFFAGVKDRIEAQVLPSLRSEGVDQELIREALDKRFDEVVLHRVRKSIPGALPEDQRAPFEDPDWDKREDAVPLWVTLVHVVFMAWTIFNAHHASLFVLGLLFFLGFAQVTAQYQNRIQLQAPLLVGFFLAGLVIHGGVQGWWIAPVLGSLSEVPLMVGATVLTAFNDNAAITYLSTLVPGFTDDLKYAVVAGAVAGGGLTVIANAPNPAGQSLLKGYFGGAVSPLGLLKAAIGPTLICWLCLALL
ncbi:putative Na+/H+ antiporter [Roseibium sp.]|uniref:putative Na+/H+ antiporter n=1 Tax=Roseibium sp. TaxID=1936156 RepID=UPI003D0E5F71